MKRFLFLLLLVCCVGFPMTTNAMEKAEYLIHADEKDIQVIQHEYPDYRQSFDVLPMLEISLTKDEVKDIQKQYPTAEVFPVQQYEVAATQEVVPPQFTLIQTKPEQTSPYTGKGVKIGVVDSGIDVNHSELDVKGGVCALGNRCPKDVPYRDDLGHGTHVAGIIAAKKNGAGIIGVAPESELYSIKVINSDNTGTTTQIITGIEWAIKNKMDILNMSITTRRNDPALELVLNKAYENGMILVGAAGNEGYGDIQNSVMYPAKYASVIAVGAINDKQEKLYESSIGPEVELAAPGKLIKSTYPRVLDLDDGERDGYTLLSGTSMASPHVAGVAALLKERFPDKTNYEIRGLLTNTAKDLGKPGKDVEFGYGLVQYVDELQALPIVSYLEDKGKILVELSNVEQTKDRKLTFGNETIKEISPGKWELYKMSGDYQAELQFTVGGKTKKFPLTILVQEPSYVDMGVERWYSKHIAYLAHHHFIFGYTDNTFKPDKRITRAEAVALLGRARDLDGLKRKTKFPDVSPNMFASGYIQSAFEAGIVKGGTDGQFRPDDIVTRGEMAILLQKAFKFPVDATQNLQFTDMSEQMASYEAVLALTQQGILQGYPDGKFKPDEPMTRATYSVFLAGAERPDIFGTKNK